MSNQWIVSNGPLDYQLSELETPGAYYYDPNASGGPFNQNGYTVLSVLGQGVVGAGFAQGQAPPNEPGLVNEDAIIFAGVGYASAVTDIASEGWAAASDAIGTRALPDKVANTFEGGQYEWTTFRNAQTLYRAEGKQFGDYYGTVAPTSAENANVLSNITSANPANTLTTLSTYQFPAGTTAPVGRTAGGIGTQVFIHEGQGGTLINSVPLPPQ